MRRYTWPAPRTTSKHRLPAGHSPVVCLFGADVPQHLPRCPQADEQQWRGDQAHDTQQPHRIAHQPDRCPVHPPQARNMLLNCSCARLRSHGAQETVCVQPASTRDGKTMSTVPCIFKGCFIVSCFETNVGAALPLRTPATSERGWRIRIWHLCCVFAWCSAPSVCTRGGGPACEHFARLPVLRRGRTSRGV